MNSVVIDQGTATVDLSAAFGSGGRASRCSFGWPRWCSPSRSSTRSTRSTPHGRETVDGIGGEGVPSGDLTRADFEA
jgi:hypothetical protein